MAGSTELDNWIVEIDCELDNCKLNGEDMQKNEKNAIYKRPVNLKENPDSLDFTPRIISFGPYHHERECGVDKSQLLLHYLNRSPNKKLKDYVEAFDDEEVKDLKNGYNKLDPKWEEDDDGFLMLLIRDGCCLLEILLEAKSLSQQGSSNHSSSRALTKVLIGSSPLTEYYRHDIMLLENQLPMQLLKKLYAVKEDIPMEEEEENLYKLILNFVDPNNAENLLKLERGRSYLHVLDLYRHCLLYGGSNKTEDQSTFLNKLLQRLLLLPSKLVEFTRDHPCQVFGLMLILFISVPTVALLLPSIVILAFICIPIGILGYATTTIQPTDIQIIPSATELQKVGIKLTMTETKGLKDICFSAPGTFNLPQFYVDGATQSRFLNIIAFEQLHADRENEVVTSYIYFMSRLLQDANDVRLLQCKRIIHTMLTYDQVVELFKSLTRDINMHHPFNILVKNHRTAVKPLTEAFYTMSNPFLKDWVQIYLKSPVAVASLLAGSYLFALTAVQTAYAALQYHNTEPPPCCRPRPLH